MYEIQLVKIEIVDMGNGNKARSQLIIDTWHGDNVLLNRLQEIVILLNDTACSTTPRTVECYYKLELSFTRSF